MTPERSRYHHWRHPINWAQVEGRTVEAGTRLEAEVIAKAHPGIVVRYPCAAVHEKIQLAAYRRWQHAGCPHGRDWEFWFAAEAEILGERQ